MQENNFEKNVRQKLDELHLTPSEPVWQKVEAAIKKKQKRRVVFWLLPLALLTGGVVLWQATAFHPVRELAVEQAKTAAAQPDSTFSKPHIAAPANTPAAAASSEVQVSQEPSATGEISKSSNGIEKASIKKSSAQTEAKNSKAHTTFIAAAKRSGIDEKTISLNNEIKNRSNDQPENVGLTDKTNKENSSEITSNNTTTQSAVVSSATAKTDSAKQTASLPDTAAVVQATIPQLKTPSKRLQWGVTAHAGLSNTVNGLHLGSGAKSMEVSDDAGQFFNNTTSLNPSPSRSYAPARQTVTAASGVQLSAGAVVKKPVGNHLYLTAGLTYSYYSSRMAVGTELTPDSLYQNWSSSTSTANMAFRNNGTQNKFTNAIHVLELPLGFEYRLLKNVPLQVQHGVSFSRLLSGKMLQYDAFSNTYLQSNANMRTISMQVFTSLDYAVLKKGTTTLHVGPYVQYGLQSLYKNTTAHHLLSGGISMSMGF